ncbi:hypothetical protein M9H77_31438 [Catharanthus roseus]|uniref:Uncharacterized protein n=1 Tax=Catharanthus roseus TaxID=4058 RepID=A0ACC0A0G3_CATRO|nr:hypothetical protein M9H77_31438 [Catharanthus roseus]
MVKVKNANVGGKKIMKKEEAEMEKLEKEKAREDISFDHRMLNTILGTPENELFTKGEVLKRHDDRNVNKLDAYGRLLHHMISNIIIPNVGHKSSITNMHSFIMLALHEHRRMNFGFMPIEHMLATQTSSTKCLSYGCFLIKVFQYFMLNLVGLGDHISIGKIYNKHIFKRMGFSRNEEGTLVRGGQESDKGEEEEDEGKMP